MGAFSNFKTLNFSNSYYGFPKQLKIALKSKELMII